MKYNNFKSMLVSSVEEHLAGKYNDLRVSIGFEEKLNKSYESIDIRIASGTALLYQFDIRNLYELYTDGRFSIDDLVEKAIMPNVETHAHDTDMLSDIRDYDSIKSKLFIRLSWTVGNNNVLAKTVHTTYSDLAVTCHILLDDSDDTISSFVINKNWLDVWEHR